MNPECVQQARKRPGQEIPIEFGLGAPPPFSHQATITASRASSARLAGLGPPFDHEDTLVYRCKNFDDEPGGAFPEDLHTWLPSARLVRLVQQITVALPPEVTPNPAARALAGVLLWCLATGCYGSWEIEVMCGEAPLCQHLAAGLSPGHADIHRYRRDHEQALVTALASLLRAAWPGPLPSPEPDFLAEAARRYARARLADTISQFWHGWVWTDKDKGWLD